MVDKKIDIPPSLQSNIGNNAIFQANAANDCTTYCEKNCVYICMVECVGGCEACEHICVGCEYSCTSCEDCQSGEGKKVTCIQQIYYDNTYVGQDSVTGLTPGYTFTPEAHLPSYDSSNYEFVRCSPSGAMTCPESNFTVNYYFKHISVTCTKEIYYDGVYVGEEYETDLWPGGVFTPDAASHIPSHSSQYKFSYCYPSSFPNGCPSSDFTVQYYFIKSGPTPWVYANGWKEATPWVYANGWKEANAHIFVGTWDNE